MRETRVIITQVVLSIGQNPREIKRAKRTRCTTVREHLDATTAEDRLSQRWLVAKDPIDLVGSFPTFGEVGSEIGNPSIRILTYRRYVSFDSG
jgi:hypothetical protein